VVGSIRRRKASGKCDGMKRKSLPVDTAPCRHLPSLFRFSIFLDFRLCRCLLFADVQCHGLNSVSQTQSRKKKAQPSQAGQRDNPTD
jgi:hypothetical protein